MFGRAKHILYKLSNMAACAITLLLLSACVYDSNDCLVPLPEQEDEDPYLQLRLRIASGTDTRADEQPKGGEDGNGREDGTNHENDINSVILLLYTTADGKGINSADDNVTIAKALSFSTLTYNAISKYYETEKMQVERTMLTSGYHVIVIANSDLNADELTGKSLSEVRDMVITQQWTAADNIADYTDFVMTSEDDAQIASLKGSGVAADPYYIDATIERMAARIDFDTTGGTKTADGSYLYPTDNDAIVFVLKSVEAFNCINTGAYLIKRVCDEKDATAVTYLGDETCNDTKEATNYVVCPYWDGNVTRGYNPDKATAESEFHSKQLSAPITGETYRILTYTQENTTADNDPETSTGLLIYGEYYDAEDWDTENNQPKSGVTGVSKEYVYYIRHSDPNGNYVSTATPDVKPDGVMTYGIVRNNIYRVSISQVKSTVDAPIININVRKWAAYSHSKIIM